VHRHLADQIAVLEFRVGNMSAVVTRERSAANGRTLAGTRILKLTP